MDARCDYVISAFQHFKKRTDKVPLPANFPHVYFKKGERRGLGVKSDDLGTRFLSTKQNGQQRRGATKEARTWYGKHAGLTAGRAVNLLML